MQKLPRHCRWIAMRGIRLVLFIATSLLSCSVLAAPRLELPSIIMSPGQVTNLSVRLTGAAEAYSGANLRIVLPAEIELRAVEAGTLLPASAVLQTHAVTVPGGVRVSVIAHSATETFSSDGEVCRVTLYVPESMAPGSYRLRFAETLPDDDLRCVQALSPASAGVSVLPATSDGALTVRLTAPGDSNGNGIPDAWEIGWFGVVTNVSHTTDFDHDGISDYYEYRGNTDPTDALSRLAISDFAVRNDVAATVLRWHSVAGKRYRVTRGDSLAAEATFEPVVVGLPATPPLNVYTDNTVSAKAHLYYKVCETP